MKARAARWHALFVGVISGMNGRSNAAELGGFQLAWSKGMNALEPDHGQKCRNGKWAKTAKEARMWQRECLRATTETVDKHMSWVEKALSRWGESKGRVD